MVSCRKDSKLLIKTGTQIVTSYIILHENAELLVVAHQGATDAASVLDTSTAQFALRIGKVADALRIALYVALLGGLSDAQHDLPPPRGDFEERPVCCAVSFRFTHILLVSSSFINDTL